MLGDLKFAARLLRLTPGLTAVALLCLALAIGLTTAAFTVVYGALLTPLPVPDGDRLVMVHEYDRAGGFNVPLNATRFTALRDHSRTLEDLGAWFSRNVTVAASGRTDGDAAIARAAHVSVNALAVLGIAPLHGRLPVEADVQPGAVPSVLLGHALWISRFGGDPRLLDQTIDVAGVRHRVIGIMPAGVAFPIREQLWIPIQTQASAVNVTTESLTLFGRLVRGASRNEAVAELSVLLASVGAPLEPPRTTIPVVMPFARGFMSPQQEWAIWAFLVGLLAFIAVIAANVANLFLARNSARAREIAMRSALGASRRRLIRQLLLESLLLGTASAVAGLALARVGLWWFLSRVEDIPWWADTNLGVEVLAFVAMATLMASVLAAIGPTLRLTRLSIAESLSSSGSACRGLRFSRAGASLLVLQLAVGVGFLSVVASLAQGLFAFSYDKYGIRGDDVLVAQVYLGPPSAADLAQGERRQVWLRHYDRSLEQFQRITDELRRLPGVRLATYSTHYPGNDVEATTIAIDARHPGNAQMVTTRIAEIGPGFFETLDTKVVEGRDFEATDRTGQAHTVIINVPFARKYFPGQSPLGQRLRLVEVSDGRATEGPSLEVVGVVPDRGLNPGDEGRADGIYIPYRPSNFARLAIRVDGEIAALIPRLHQIVRRENADAQVQSAQTLEAQMDTAQNVFRGLGVGLLVVGGTALLLSAVSFYSLMAFSVTRRTREIGIRVAIGATRAAIVWDVLAPGLLVIGSGVAVGAMIGAGLYQLVTLIPFDLRPAGPSVLWAVAVLVVVGIAACVGPARRAASIAPSEALRHE